MFNSTDPGPCTDPKLNPLITTSVSPSYIYDPILVSVIPGNDGSLNVIFSVARNASIAALPALYIDVPSKGFIFIVSTPDGVPVTLICTRTVDSPPERAPPDVFVTLSIVIPVAVPPFATKS